jgi:hypothetical protein
MTGDILRIDPCPACREGVVLVWECSRCGVHMACSFGCLEEAITAEFLAEPAHDAERGHE